MHFRERGSQLNQLEEFLRGDDPLAVIYGGPGYGKTALIERLLSTRVYEKCVVRIEAARIRSAWAFLESFLSQVGVRVEPDTLSVLKEFSISHVKAPLGRLLNSIAPRLIVVVDDFHLMLTPLGEIFDNELAEVFDWIVGKAGSKVILSGRREYPPQSLIKVTKRVPSTIRVGRFNTEEAVLNILDDHFDRSSAGIVEYPASLLAAIDRHPLIAMLAARALKAKGRALLLDSRFIAELKGRLRAELWGRIVPAPAREAVLAAASLRVAVPDSMLEALAEKESVASARSFEVLYSQPDNRWVNVWTTLGLFRVTSDDARDDDEEDGNRSGALDHNRIASLYRSLYAIDDDPKWIRESYYHQLIAFDLDAGNLPEGMGKYYFDELILSADYKFSKLRRFDDALHLYRAASNIRKLPQVAAMRHASCLVRLGDRDPGEKLYSGLVEEFPRTVGIKTSHVDAVIYTGDYAHAEKVMNNYELTDETEWTQWQWGRIYLGLDKYESAISYLNKIVSLEDSDPHYFIYLARALDYAGDFDGALKVLRMASNRYADDVGVATSLGAQLVRLSKFDEGRSLLEPLIELHDGDNVQAAAAMVKVELERGDLGSARRIIQKAKTSGPAKFRALAECGISEIRIAEGRPDLALIGLSTLPATDPVVWTTILACHLANIKTGSKDALAQARKLDVPNRYDGNARLLLLRAELALVLRNETMWNEVIDRLSRTRYPAASLGELRSKWLTC